MIKIEVNNMSIIIEKFFELCYNRNMDTDVENKRLHDGAQDTEESSGVQIDDVVSDGRGAGLSKAEMRRRKRSVKATRTLFRAIDFLFSQSQNACPYVTEKNVVTIKSTTDIVYDGGNARTCLMDFYEGETTGENAPAVLLIHGGGFAAGDKKFRRGLAEFFVLNGFKVFCVNYGLAPESVFPEPIRQLIVAGNAIYDRAEEFGINKDKIFVAGDSAGGYYAAMLGAISCNPDFRDKFGCALKFKVFGALLNCGLYDLQTVLDTKYFLDVDAGVFLSFTGIAKREFDSYEHKDICMPLHHITPDFPPTFFIYSPRDMFCKGQGEAFKTKLDECGVYYECYAARHNTSNHCFSLNWRGEDASAANELMISFAKRLAADKIKL